MMNSYRRRSVLASMKRTALTFALTSAAGLASGMGGLLAQETFLLKKELAGTKGQEGVVTIHPDVAPGRSSSGKHSHPGDQFVYVLEGYGTLEVEGKPPLPLKPGVAYHVAPNEVHEVKNGGTGALKGVGVTIAKPGEPLVVPLKK